MDQATDARCLAPAAQAQLRRRAMAAVRSGHTQTEVAALFGVSLRAVQGWVARTRHGGLVAIKARPRGRPKGTRLSAEQTRQIIRLLRDKRPDQLKLPFYLWTREAVVQLIGQVCGVSISVWTAGRYLKAWGFTPQKPVRRAYERNPRAVARWLKTDYPKIRAQAKREKAEIYWADEMGVRSDQPAGRSFSPRGETPMIPGTGQRFGCNQLSALTNRGHLLFMVFQCGFTTRVFLEFLRRLERQARRPVFLIVDGHPVHKARAVKAWLARSDCRVRLYFLPSYSPELNPDELLNHDVKAYVGRHRPRTRTELVHTVRTHLRRRQRQPHIVRRFFHGKHVQYAAA